MKPVMHLGPAQPNALLTAVLAALALGGCATKATQPAWRIVPSQTVTHGAGSAEGYYAIGRQIEASRDWARAADAYRQALQVDPGHVDARNALAVALARLGRLDDAKAQLRQVLAAAPQRADLHSNLGFLLLLAQRPEQAQVALHTALALDPRDRVARANLQLAQGRVPTAEAPATALAQTGAAAPQALPPAVQAGAEFAPAVAEAATTPAAAAEGPAAPPPFTMELSNGMGRRGAAQQLRQQLLLRGFEVRHTANLPPYRQPYTVVSYRPGHAAAAQRVAKALPLSVQLQPNAAQRTDVRVVLGHDWPAAVHLSDAGAHGRE